MAREDGGLAEGYWKEGNKTAEQTEEHNFDPPIVVVASWSDYHVAS